MDNQLTDTTIDNQQTETTIDSQQTERAIDPQQIETPSRVRLRQGQYIVTVDKLKLEALTWIFMRMDV